LVDSYCYLPQEYEDDMEAMHRATARLTDHDCERLTKIWRSALAAAASVEPYAFETVVAPRAYVGNRYWYYRRVFSMVEEVEEEKRGAEWRKKELSE
jgi:hypothetical protein